MITITLRQILDAEPCYDPRDKGLLPADHDLDAPISFREIAGAVLHKDAAWCFAHLPGYDGLKRHFAVDCAERVRHLMKDERSLDALAVARRYADGQATDEELNAASDAAKDAALAARDVVTASVGGDILSAKAAWDAARAAVWASARVAADAAAVIEAATTGEIVWAARASAWAARASAWAVTWDAASAAKASAWAGTWAAAENAGASAWAEAKNAGASTEEAGASTEEAGDAAWAAETAWQARRIIELTDAGRWERSEELQ